jgi:hypothetical protein
MVILARHSSAGVGRVGPSQPRFLCDSGRTGARGGRHVKKTLVHAVIGSDAMHTHTHTLDLDNICYVKRVHGSAITWNRIRRLRVWSRTPYPSTALKIRYPLGIYIIYIPPYCPSNGLPQYIHYWRDSRTKTPPEYNVRMCPLSCPPWGSYNMLLSS